LRRNFARSCTLNQYKGGMKPSDFSYERGNVMKAITAIAAAALLFGVTAASAQAPSSGASKPGSTTNTDSEVPAKGASPSNNLPATGGSAPAASGTMGAGSSKATGTTQGSNPNPATNKNPDPEVPGKKQN
jgi:hypothetical protein